MNVLYRVGAIVAGLIAGVLVVTVIEAISSLIYPMPPGFSMDNKEAMSDWIKSLPVGAFLIVLLAFVSGSGVGAFVARILTPNRGMVSSLIVIGFFLAATIYTLLTYSHPTWFWISSIAGVLVFGIIAMVLASPKTCVVHATRMIDAELERVFHAISTVDGFSKAVPNITKVEFISDQKTGVGTRFRETRLMHGKEAATELEITELVDNQHARFVSDAGGTIWDTLFTVRQINSGVEMKMQMDARPYKFSARFLIPMILGIVAKAVEEDMDSIKRYCEQGQES